MRAATSSCAQKSSMPGGPDYRSRPRAALPSGCRRAGRSRECRSLPCGCFLPARNARRVWRRGPLVSSLSLQSRRRGARDDRQIPKPRKPGRDVLAETVGKRLHLRVTRALERKHGDPQLFAAPATAGAVCPLACRNFSGTSGLPSSLLYRLKMWTRTPCFTSTSPRSCSCGCHCHIVQDPRPRASKARCVPHPRNPLLAGRH
jgi:hypothetical protein